MGTQFWWFYDVLVLSMTAGIIYAAVVRGFNKGVIRLIMCILAVVLGIFGSDLLKERVYENIFRQKIRSTVSAVLDDETWVVFEEASGALALTAAEGDEVPEPDIYEKAELDFREGRTEAYPEWFVNSVCNVTEYLVSSVQKPHAQQSLAALYETDAGRFCDLTEYLRLGDAESAAKILEEDYYHPAYVRMIRMALFLLIQLVMLIIGVIISSMAGNLEEQMHIRRGDHLLGIPAGLAEAAGVLLALIAAVRLIVALTDGEMLLFNLETIDETKIFRYIYYL